MVELSSKNLKMYLYNGINDATVPFNLNEDYIDTIIE